jgi:transcriptional regulator with XRE-family HTH domain
MDDSRSAASADRSEGSWPRDWGRLLRLARQVAGMSLTELSVECGLSKGYLSKLESGHFSARNPSRATLAALARALPSFRPLAHTLEPAAPLGELAFAEAPPDPPVVIRRADGVVVDSPVRLGWRELEALVALLVLNRAALPLPANAIVASRALDRSVAETVHVLERLVRMGVLVRLAPTRFGSPPEYRPAGDFAARTGVSRAGDALVLAASLLAQASRPIRPAADAERQDVPTDDVDPLAEGDASGEC